MQRLQRTTLCVISAPPLPVNEPIAGSNIINTDTQMTAWSCQCSHSLSMYITSVNHPGNGKLIKQEKQEKQENLFWHDGVLTKGKMHPKTKIQSKGRNQFAFSNLLFILNNSFFVNQQCGFH